MNLPNSMPSQVNVCIVDLNRLYNLKLPVFKFLRERTNHFENQQIYHPNFVWYAETSSLGDINLMSYHLTAFELINQYQLHYITFLSLQRKIFQKDLKSTLASSVALWFRNLSHNLVRTNCRYLPGLHCLYDRLSPSWPHPFGLGLPESIL